MNRVNCGGYTILATQTNILTHIVSFVQSALLLLLKMFQDRFSTPSKPSVDKTAEIIEKQSQRNILKLSPLLPQ